MQCEVPYRGPSAHPCLIFCASLQVMPGLLLGGALPFVFSGFTMLAVGKAAGAGRQVELAHQQRLRQAPGRPASAASTPCRLPAQQILMHLGASRSLQERQRVACRFALFKSGLLRPTGQGIHRSVAIGVNTTQG